MPDRPGAAARRLVAARAKNRCEYCLTPAGLAPSPFAAEHIKPKSQGGNHDVANLAFSCPGCNGHKASKTLVVEAITFSSVRLYNPRVEDWRHHFRWSEDGLHLEGVSIIGRATVQALRLNRPGLVNLRRLMILDGIHPLQAESS